MVSCNLTAPEVQVGATIKIETNNGLIAEGIVISLDALRKVRFPQFNIFLKKINIFKVLNNQ